MDRIGMASTRAGRLASLLARIHRDGGHHLEQHGYEVACVDAERIIVELYAERDALRARVAELERQVSK